MLLQENCLAINQQQALYLTIDNNNNSYLSAIFHYTPKTFDNNDLEQGDWKCWSGKCDAGKIAGVENAGVKNLGADRNDG